MESRYCSLRNVSRSQGMIRQGWRHSPYRNRLAYISSKANSVRATSATFMLRSIAALRRSL